MNTLEELIKLFKEHREKLSFSPCSPDCFCWEFEAFINQNESLENISNLYNTLYK